MWLLELAGLKLDASVPQRPLEDGVEPRFGIPFLGLGSLRELPRGVVARRRERRRRKQSLSERGIFEFEFANFAAKAIDEGRTFVVEVRNVVLDAADATGKVECS